MKSRETCSPCFAIQGLGKQNSLFPLGPVIECLMFTVDYLRQINLCLYLKCTCNNSSPVSWSYESIPIFCPTPATLFLDLYTVKCNLTELTTRSVSLASVVSGQLEPYMCQDSTCSWATRHSSSFTHNYSQVLFSST